MGYQISPGELEAIIEKISDVLAVSIVGISDPLYGDLPAAAVVKKAEGALTEQEVTDFVAQQVSVNKQIRGGVYFLDSLPRTPSGKVQAKVVREMLTKLYKQKL